MRKTKIVATLGPATDDPEIMRELVRAGMNVARFNFSHGAYDEMRTRLGLLRSVCAELRANVAALADTKGPEIRLGTFKGGTAELRAGDTFRLSAEPCEGDAGRAYVTYAGLPGDVSPGARILLDDGLIELRVTGVSGNEIVTEVVNGGPVSNHKGVNVPAVTLRLPFLSEKDRADLRFITEMGFDYIAASFTRDAADIKELRNELRSLNVLNSERSSLFSTEILIIAKIENADGVKNLDEIIGSADGVMVARGDLGVEMPLEDIPVLQKRMIRETRRLGKVVITATQMLESMIHNPRPTRAEVSDVANAIYDGTSAIMLSGETAAGHYPVEAVRTMAGIAAYTERAIDYRAAFRGGGHEARFGAGNPRGGSSPCGGSTLCGGSDFGGESGQELSVVNAIAHATVTTAHDLGAAAILTVTMSGQTARNIAKFSPACPIIACSTDPAVVRRLALVWGVYPVPMDAQYDTGALFEQAARLAETRFGLARGDLIVISAGVPLNEPGTTNMLKVHEIGDDNRVI